MTGLLTGTTELVVQQCWCGIWHAIPKSLNDAQRQQFDDGLEQTGIYCPVGHEWTRSGQSESDRLNKRLQAERARHDQTKAELRETEARRRGEKAAKTRLKKQVAAGSCPVCRRPFANLARHMAGQHPKYATC